MKTVSVVVSKCTEDGRSVYERISEERFASVPAAVNATETLKKKGVCVIIRPNYNEEDEKGRYFREWRSFNGEQFKEHRFYWTGN